MAVSRQRDLFPLPEPFPNAGVLSSARHASKAMRRRLRATGCWQQWANDTVGTLNQLNGGSKSLLDNHLPTLLQQVSLDEISSACREMGKPPSDLHPAGAFFELCGSKAPYFDLSGGPIPYEQGNISLPAECPACDGLGLIPAEHRDKFFGSESSLLNNSDEISTALLDAGVKKPYVDDAFRSPKIYGGFLSELFDKGIVSFRTESKSFLGIFFVRKKNGKLRMILDTRIANCFFKSPPHTDLPTASAMSNIETRPGEFVYFSGGDIDNAFYRITAPDVAKPYFTLPRVRAGHVGISEIDGVAVSPSTYVTPSLEVLPMGWSWSLWICQCLHEEQGRRSGQVDDDMICDHQAVKPLCRSDVRHAKYVDNYLTIGHDPHTVELSATRLQAQLNSEGLATHEIISAKQHVTFAGLDFDGEHATVRVGVRRAWRLRLAIDHILGSKAISGAAIEVIVGHFTWSAMVRRESLSIVSACYEFIRTFREKTAELWPSVVKELCWMRSILPMLRRDLSASWDSTITATDASNAGFGVCERHIDTRQVGNIGRVSERWRFNTEDAIHARKHAMQQASETKAVGLDTSDILDASLDDQLLRTISTFEAVPEHITSNDQKQWVTIQSRRWKFQEDIMRTEGRALVWAVRRKARSTKSRGKRHLILCDNLCLVLALAKGRAGSSHLLPTCRAVCALAFAAGFSVHTRWIHSEANPADRPSRIFPDSRKQHGAEGSDSPPSQGTSISHHRGRGEDQGEVQGSQAPAGPLSVAPQQPCAQPGRDLPAGEDLCPGVGGGRLLQARRHLPGVAGGQPIGPQVCPRGSNVPARTPGPPVPGRSWASGWQQAAVCCPPHLSGTPGGNGGGEARPACPLRVAEASPGGDTRGDPRRGGVCTDRHAPIRGNGPSGTLPGHAAQHLLQARRELCDQSERCYQADCQQARGRTGAGSVGNQVHHQDGRVGRKRPDQRSQGRVDQQGTPGAVRGPPRSRAALPLPAGGVHHELPQVAPHAQPRKLPLLAVQCPPRRAVQRFPPPPAGPRRHQEPRPLEKRLQCTPLHKGHQVAAAGSRDQPQGHQLRDRRHGQHRRDHGRPGGAPHLLSPDQQVSKLKMILERALRHSLRQGRRQVCLELFSGKGGISQAFCKRGWGVVSVDLNQGFDLTCKLVVDLITGWISSRVVAAVWLGTPCSSWSRARHDIDGHGPRTRSHIHGCPGLGPLDEERIKIGNQTMKVSARFIQCAKLANIPCGLENPDSSMLWLAPEISKLIRDALIIKQDYCQYGCRWRKRTRFAFWNVTDPSPFETKICHGRGGVCSVSNRPHIILKGKDPATGIAWTKIAEPYPKKLCLGAVNMILGALDNLRLHRLQSLVI